MLNLNAIVLRSALLCLMFGTTAYAERSHVSKSGPVLTGSVVKISTRCIDGIHVPQVGVYLQFRNDDAVPWILITPSYLFQKRVEFLSSEVASSVVVADTLSFNPYLENPWGTPSSSDYDPSPGFVRSLDTAEPPRILAPGSYFEFHDTLWFKNGFRIEIQKGHESKKCEQQTVTATPEYPFFIVQYSLSVKKYPQGTDLLNRLKDRWRPFGILDLHKGGDLYFKSDKIFLKVDN